MVVCYLPLFFLFLKKRQVSFCFFFLPNSQRVLFCITVCETIHTQLSPRASLCKILLSLILPDTYSIRMYSSFFISRKYVPLHLWLGAQFLHQRPTICRLVYVPCPSHLLSSLQSFLSFLSTCILGELLKFALHYFPHQFCSLLTSMWILNLLLLAFVWFGVCVYFSLFTTAPYFIHHFLSVSSLLYHRGNVILDL